jgi:hypothetical protein
MVGNATWIYVLESEGFGRLVLEYAPDGWSEAKVSIKRSPTFSGLFRSFNTSLKFVKDGKDYIQNVYETKGTEWKINIGIYQYNPIPVDKYLLFFAGLIDLSTYKIDETTIEVTINESSLARKLMSRDDIKISLGRNDSIEGKAINAINPTSIYLHQRELLSSAVFQLNPEVATVRAQFNNVGESDKGFALPIMMVTNDIPNVVSPYETKINEQGSWFWGASGRATGALSITIKIKGTMGIVPTDAANVRHFISVRLYTDTSLTAWSDTEIWSYDGELEPGRAVDINQEVGIFNVTDDNVIALVASMNPRGAAAVYSSYTSTFTEIAVNVAETIFVDGSYADGYKMHEVGQKICEVIADEKGVFKSDFYGRTDIGYPVNGEGSQASYHSGKQIRGFSDSPVLSLMDFYKSEDSIYGMGLGIEYNAVGYPILRMEKKQHFYSGDVILTIHSATEVVKEVAREWIFNEVEVGYEKAEYEEVNGLEEYNNKFTFSTIIQNIKNKLNLISKVRADGYGIEFARRKSKAAFPTEDTQYDNDVFKIILNGNSSAKAENFDIVENIFSANTAYNLDITPGRMLRNNGAFIRAGIEKYLDDKVKFQSAEQKANLKSQRIGQSAITENEDIDPSTLAAPLWIPEIYSFKSVLTREQLAIISKKPNGIVKFSPQSASKTQAYYYGWILEVDGEIDGQESEWKLLRVNTKNSSLQLVDPEGSTPGNPPIIVNPSAYVGVFEGSFEFVFAG